MRIFLFICLASVCWEARAQTLPDPTRNALDLLVLRDVPEGGAGLAAGIIRNGQVAYERCAGLASIPDSVSIGQDTRFNLASNGKQFTALAILLLERQKRLKLTEDFRRYLPGFFPQQKKPITIAQLLQHRSGIRDIYDLMALQGKTWWRFGYGNEEVYELLRRQSELNFEPGTAYRYSNSNYLLLAGVVEKASGKTFRQFTDSLFAALGMPATAFETEPTAIAPPVARPYFNFSTWTTYDWIWKAAGDGNLFSTLRDQLRWEQLLQTGLPGWTDVLRKSQSFGSSDYGYGLERGRFRGWPYLFHEGATGAWKATVLRFPEQKTSIITLTNSGKVIPYDLSRELAAVVLGAKTEPAFPLRPARPGSYVSLEQAQGIYRNAGGQQFRIEKRDTSLYLLRNGRNDIRLVREQANIFHQWNDSSFKQEFFSDPKGWHLRAYHTSHPPYALDKIEADWTGFDHRAFNGDFFNEETGVLIGIRWKKNQEYVFVRGTDSSTAFLVTPHLLVVDGYILKLVYANGKPNRLMLDGDRIRQVRFERRPGNSWSEK